MLFMQEDHREFQSVDPYSKEKPYLERLANESTFLFFYQNQMFKVTFFFKWIFALTEVFN